MRMLVWKTHLGNFLCSLSAYFSWIFLARYEVTHGFFILNFYHLIILDFNFSLYFFIAKPSQIFNFNSFSRHRGPDYSSLFVFFPLPVPKDLSRDSFFLLIDLIDGLGCWIVNIYLLRCFWNWESIHVNESNEISSLLVGNYLISLAHIERYCGENSKLIIILILLVIKIALN